MGSRNKSVPGPEDGVPDAEIGYVGIVKTSIVVCAASVASKSRLVVTPYFRSQPATRELVSNV